MSLVVLQCQVDNENRDNAETEDDIVSQADKWISIAEAARIKGVQRPSIYAAIKEGRIRAAEIGGRSVVLRQDVEAYVPRAYQGIRTNIRPDGVKGPGGRPPKQKKE